MLNLELTELVIRDLSYLKNLSHKQTKNQNIVKLHFKEKGLKRLLDNDGNLQNIYSNEKEVIITANIEKLNLPFNFLT